MLQPDNRMYAALWPWLITQPFSPLSTRSGPAGSPLGLPALGPPAARVSGVCLLLVRCIDLRTGLACFVFLGLVNALSQSWTNEHANSALTADFPVICYSLWTFDFSISYLSSLLPTQCHSHKCISCRISVAKTPLSGGALLLGLSCVYIWWLFTWFHT